MTLSEVEREALRDVFSRTDTQTAMAARWRIAFGSSPNWLSARLRQRVMKSAPMRQIRKHHRARIHRLYELACHTLARK